MVFIKHIGAMTVECEEFWSHPNGDTNNGAEIAEWAGAVFVDQPETEDGTIVPHRWLVWNTKPVPRVLALSPMTRIVKFPDGKFVAIPHKLVDELFED